MPTRETGHTACRAKLEVSYMLNIWGSLINCHMTQLNASQQL